MILAKKKMVLYRNLFEKKHSPFLQNGVKFQNNLNLVITIFCQIKKRKKGVFFFKQIPYNLFDEHHIMFLHIFDPKHRVFSSRTIEIFSSMREKYLTGNKEKLYIFVKFWKKCKKIPREYSAFFFRTKKKEHMPVYRYIP